MIIKLIGQPNNLLLKNETQSHVPNCLTEKGLKALTN
jgi:hypothetical protein